jgi:murein DD-endopeptidase MepM/ murein hydrolase activator NlpD
MRRLLLLPGIAIVLASLPSTVLAQSGGAVAPDAANGGHAFGQPVEKPVVKVPRLRASVFAVTPGTVKPGDPLRFTYRVDGRVPRVRVRIDLLRADGGAATRLRLGRQRTGRRLSHVWTGELAPGRYVARLNASGAGGARLRRTARASGRSPLEIVAEPAPPPPAPTPTPTPVPLTAVPGSGVFPVQGPYSFGGPEARFGAERTGHVHQGQDVIAAEGTPLVTPRAGVVYWRAYQAAGAGHYVVIRADDGRDYVFMHLQDGSLLVSKGQAVTAGQRIGSVGNTGDSRGAHLHFEIWPHGWFSSDTSKPIDPLPDLEAWAAG